MKTAAILIATPPVAVGFIWLMNTVAGTLWSLPFVAALVIVAFCGAWLSDRRPFGSTALQRFEQRQERREAA